MGNWEWLVPVIILLIWIVNHFLRGADDDRPANRQRPGGERPPRRSTSEIDRFLDEVNRRRRQAAERRPAPPPPPRERPAPAPARGTRSAAQPRPASPRPAPAPRVVRPPLERRPERPPAVEPVLVVEAVPEPLTAPAFPSEPAPAHSAPPAPASTSNQPPSPAMAQLVSLLASPDNLRTAVMLHEIFSAPLCYRKGHRVT